MQDLPQIFKVKVLKEEDAQGMYMFFKQIKL